MTGESITDRRERIRRRRDQELEATAMEAKEFAMQGLARIDTHEAVCAERYKGIREDMKATQSDIKAIGKLLVTVLLAIAGTAIMVIVTHVLEVRP